MQEGENREQDVDRDASLAFQQEKDKANLEYARRISHDASREAQEQPRIYDELGKEQTVESEITGLYQDSSIADKIAKRRESSQSPVALFTDIDNSFYRKGQVDTTQKLDHMLNDNNWGLIYETGRDFSMVDSQADLPKADVVVGAVGTEISLRKKDGTYIPDEEYRKLLLGTWDRDEVYAKSQQIVAANPEIIFQERDVPGAFEAGQTNQPPQEFKISFNVSGDNSVAERIKNVLEQDIAGARVVLSQDMNDPMKWNIDLLPIHAGKELAVRYLSGKLGVRGMAAGDSGNDLTMLTDSGHPAILVGGAHEGVKSSIMQFGTSSSFSSEARELPSGHRIIIGDDKTDLAAQGIINVLGQGDLNPEDAKWFVKSMYELSKREE